MIWTAIYFIIIRYNISVARGAYGEINEFKVFDDARRKLVQRRIQVLGGVSWGIDSRYRHFRQFRLTFRFEGPRGDPVGVLDVQYVLSVRLHWGSASRTTQSATQFPQPSVPCATALSGCRTDPSFRHNLPNSHSFHW